MGKTILIVDSSAIMRRVIERALRLAGLEPQQVLDAENGDDALRLVQESKPDLILSEVSLAGITGLEVLRQLRDAEATRNLPVVFITTVVGEAQVQEAVALGAQGYIRKPFTADQVKDYIAPLFG